MPARTAARRRYTAEEIQAWRERKELLDQVYRVNIIDFAREYFGGRDEDAAIEMILGCRALPTHRETPREKPKPKGPIVVPDKAPDFNRAIAYLIKTRGIDKEIVYEMIKQGRVFQSFEYRKDKDTGERKGPYQNICFVGFDEKGAIRSGAMRSMSDQHRFRMDFINNDKIYGFTMPGTSNRLYVFEAPIDAMSHATLFKLQGADWRRDHRLSEGCLADNALARYLKQHPEIEEIIWCFDNDYEGVDDKGQPHNHGQLAAAKYQEIYQKKYRTRIDTPTENGVNVDLRIFRGWVKPAVRNVPPPASPRQQPAAPAVRQNTAQAADAEEEEWDG